MTHVHDPAELPIDYVAAFNSGDPTAVDDLYEEHAVLVPGPGNPATGNQRRAATEHLLGLGQPMRATPRHVYTAGDTALAVVDWTLPGSHLSGTAADVLRRDADGRWRYLIDNPFGTA